VGPFREQPRSHALSTSRYRRINRGAWWLRGLISSERIATLEERLRLAGDKQKTVASAVDQLTTQVSYLSKQIETQTPLPQLVASTADVTSTIHDLSSSTTALGVTLTPQGGIYSFMPRNYIPPGTS
jgi:hypothetical protein